MRGWRCCHPRRDRSCRQPLSRTKDSGSTIWSAPASAIGSESVARMSDGDRAGPGHAVLIDHGESQNKRGGLSSTSGTSKETVSVKAPSSSSTASSGSTTAAGESPGVVSPECQRHQWHLHPWSSSRRTSTRSRRRAACQPAWSGSKPTPRKVTLPVGLPSLPVSPPWAPSAVMYWMTKPLAPEILGSTYTSASRHDHWQNPVESAQSSREPVEESGTGVVIHNQELNRGAAGEHATGIIGGTVTVTVSTVPSSASLSTFKEARDLSGAVLPGTFPLIAQSIAISVSRSRWNPRPIVVSGETIHLGVSDGKHRLLERRRTPGRRCLPCRRCRASAIGQQSQFASATSRCRGHPVS